jgi:hypothetical protein
MNIIQIQQSEMLQALNKSEVDIRISTAKQYPRHLPDVLNKIATRCGNGRPPMKICGVRY